VFVERLVYLAISFVNVVHCIEYFYLLVFCYREALFYRILFFTYILVTRIKLSVAYVVPILDRISSFSVLGY